MSHMHIVSRFHILCVLGSISFYAYLICARAALFTYALWLLACAGTGVFISPQAKMGEKRQRDTFALQAPVNEKNEYQK